MTWIYEALEMHDRRGKPLGRFRVVRWEYTTPTEIEGLCDHGHLTLTEALNCPDAREFLEEQFSDHPRLADQELN